MYSLVEFFSKLDEIAPISISYQMIEKGDYDNSGILIHCHDSVKKVLFSLDLSIKAVEYAIRIGADTIVTHHPAIYTPIKSLSYLDATQGAILTATKNNLNVISMHLNLDLAKNGIDYHLCKAISGQEGKILSYLDGVVGYGREFKVEKPLNLLVLDINKALSTNKTIVYAKSDSQFIVNGASFCGGGATHALKEVETGNLTANAIVTSDMPHHIIKELVERDKVVILVTHYSAENFGFNKFYQMVKNLKLKDLSLEYFCDQRFL